MRLKIFLVPFFVVMILIISIGYIKPDIETVQVKRTDISSKEAMIANMETTLSNIRSLNGSLDVAQEAEQFAYRYLPETLNQDQVIDAFNFLATQSGLTIAAMDLRQPPAPAVREEPIVDPSSAPFVTGARTANAQDAQVMPPQKVKTFILTGSVVGPYENIKAFFDRFSHTERFREVRLFSIKVDTQSISPEGVVDINRLKGIFEAEFGYLPKKPVPSAFGMPVFTRPQFDFSELNKWLERTTNTVPTLEQGQTGKPNPFQ